MKIIDISQEILSCQVYPGDPVPQGHKQKSMASLYPHTGTTMFSGGIITVAGIFMVTEVL